MSESRGKFDNLEQGYRELARLPGDDQREFSDDFSMVNRSENNAGNPQIDVNIALQIIERDEDIVGNENQNDQNTPQNALKELSLKSPRKDPKNLSQNGTELQIESLPTLLLNPTPHKHKYLRLGYHPLQAAKSSQNAQQGAYQWKSSVERRILTHVLSQYLSPCFFSTAWVLLILLAQILWNYSLVSCEYDIVVCIKWLRGKFVPIILYVLGYTMIHFYVLIHSLLVKSKRMKVLGLFLSIGSFFYRYSVSEGFSNLDHSKANMTICLMILVLASVLLGWFVAAYLLYRVEKTKFWFWAYIGFWVGFGVFLWNARVRKSCEHLQDSLDPAVKYSDAGPECTWVKAPICWHFVIEGIFRPLFWGRDDCAAIPTDMNDHRAASHKTGIMSYPLVTEADFNTKNNQYKLQEYVVKNFKEETEESMETGPREVFIDFRTNPEGEIKLKLKNLKNDQNPEIQKRVKPVDSEHQNILLIFIDTVSRPNFFRKYKKTVEFLRRYNFSLKQKLRAFEYFRLHSIRGYTFPNLFASTYGAPYSISFDVDHHVKRIESYAKEEGYITGYTSDACTYTECEVSYGNDPYIYSDDQDADHIFNQIGCDYNLLPKENPYTFGTGRGPYAVSRNCFLGRDATGLSLEYMSQFFSTYKDDRKLFSARIISAHEFTGENNWYIDEQLNKYLRVMDEKGFLDNTLTFIYSDHGDHIDFIMWQTMSGYSELMNPFLVILVPETIGGEILGNLEANQQRLITHYEIFQSVRRFIGAEKGPDEQPGPSLFYDVVDGKETCETAHVYEDCKCFPKKFGNFSDNVGQK